MIGSIKGKIILKTEKFVLVETNGVGYKISVSPEILAKKHKKEEEIFLFIHSHVREDAFDLYGFLEQEELEFFGADQRHESDIEGMARIPSEQQLKSNKVPSFNVIGNSPIVLRESLLDEVYTMGENFVEA